jgi:hypothetical protein
MKQQEHMRILGKRVKSLWGSRLIEWQENRHILKRTICRFAPAPINGFARRPRSPYGYSKRFNYIYNRRITWFKVYKFLASH